MRADRLTNDSGWGGASRKFIFATVLTVVAGYVDAIGYMQLGHLYLSFMSGNSTRLGISLSSLEWTDALGVVWIVAMFVAGAAIGTILNDRFPLLHVQAILVVELVFTIVAFGLCLLGMAHIGLTLVADAMGMQNCLHQVVTRADIGKGFITGNLFGLGQALARTFSDHSWASTAAEHLVSWLAFLTGVVFGGLSVALLSLLVSLGFLTIVLIGLLSAFGARPFRREAP